MSMLKRLKTKNSKKAFTIIELVIVIAILSILAAIAIPVITTTINSAKLSVMESNMATVEMLIKEAVNTSKTNLRTTYNNKTPNTATVEDVLIQNDVDLEVMDVQDIGGVEYAIYWKNATQGMELKSGTSVDAFDITTLISDLD